MSWPDGYPHGSSFSSDPAARLSLPAFGARPSYAGRIASAVTGELRNDWVVAPHV
jgi:hypothetical protein